MFGYSLLYLSLALLAGLTMAVQGTINSVLGKKVGLLEATLFVHLSATIILILLLCFRYNRGLVQRFQGISWYFYLGGILGVVITYTVVVSIPRLGVAVATTAIIAAQVLTAAAIDHFGLFGMEAVPFNWYKLLGISLLAAGVRLLLG